MTQYLRAYVERAADGEPGDSDPVRFVASTEGVKRDGKDLRTDQWDLNRFLTHPVVLYAHDYFGRNLPIGTAKPFFDDRKLMMDVSFDSDDEFAMRVRAKSIKGMMGGSVGWDEKIENKQAVNELLEFSIVPVPMDPAALPVRQKRGYADLADWLDDVVNDEHSIKPTLENVSDVDLWGGVAGAMLALYRPTTTMEDDERRGIYNLLERLYGKLSKVAPEWRESADLADLTETEIRGLFLEGEYTAIGDVRAGAVLSARNRADLEQAISLIGSVLERAKKEAEQSDGNEDSDGDRSMDQDSLHKLRLREIQTKLNLLGV